MAPNPSNEQEPEQVQTRLTGEQRKYLRRLVQHVARAFYEPKYVVIMDQLCRHDFLKDEELYGRIGCPAKDGAKQVARLANDGLVMTHSQNEQKDPMVNRSTSRKYYYIDYKHFCNVVKWRMAQMHRIIDEKLRNELAYKGYVCLNCKATYSLLDAGDLLDLERNVLVCSVCGATLTDNDDAGEAGKDKMQRFNAQTGYIREGMRRAEDIVFPPFDVIDLIRKHAAAQAAEAAGAAPGDGLAIAGANGSSSAHVQKFSVEIVQDMDNEARRIEKESEANAKRQQNALPEWHIFSTVTGERTAFGNVIEAGTSGANGALNPALQPGASNKDSKLDIKPKRDENAEYVDQYYATLQTSTVDGLIRIDTAGDMSSDEDDLDTVPLSQSSQKGKRRRDEEVDEVKADRLSKSARFGNGRDLSRASSRSNSTPAAPAPEEDTGMNSEEDPMVYVKGVPMPYSQVTEEHHELMTPEEYEQFFIVMQNLNG